MAAATSLSPLFLSLNSFHFPPKEPSFFKPKLHGRLPDFSTSRNQFLPLPVSSLSNPQNIDTFFPLSSLDSSYIETDDLFNLLRLSVKYSNIDLARAVHAASVKLDEDTQLGNALISAYVKLGFVVDAHGVFKHLSSPDAVAYSTLISGFAKLNKENDAIVHFFRMRSSGVEVNEYSLLAILIACIRISELELGLQVHGLIIKLGYLECTYVANALMSLYDKSGCFDYVTQLFDEMPQRDIVTWNTAISSLVNQWLYEKALRLFQDLHQTTGFRADRCTLLSVLAACAGCHAVMGGREVHAYAIRIGLEANLSINNAIIGFYTKCGGLKDVLAVFDKMPAKDIISTTQMSMAYMEFRMVDLAVEVFENMPVRNTVSYNALLAGFCKNGEGSKALDLFLKMVQERVGLTDLTLTSIVNACGILMSFEISRQIHGFVTKVGFGSNACIETALLDMYTRCGRMKDAEKIFRSWPSDWDSSIIWTSMLCGYARNGMPEEAISLFHQSQLEGAIVVDEVALASILGVCGTLGFHEMGEQIHSHALKSGFLANVVVGNSIISMYSKCCSMNDAIKSFNIMPIHDIVSWNCLIAGHLLHRQGDEALDVWSRMVKEGIKPDSVTFILIILAYRHTSSNLVDDCRNLFLCMKKVYEVDPTSEHYASLVSVLGYWDLLEEAEETIIKMPFEPEAFVWRALLESCRYHSNMSMGLRVVKRIVAMEPQDPSTYALVSNLYLASGRWNCSELVRENMRKKGLRKHPCRSWIIHQKEVHSFCVRDQSHYHTKDIYSGIDRLILECLKLGYVPNTSFTLQDVEEHQKKEYLFYHSAKLAATYGLLVTKRGKPIRIVKNILLCGDCHVFLKYVSVVTRREIILRDTSGFHHFSNGHCSCKDYWR